MGFVCAGAEEEGPGGEDAEGDAAGVDEEPCCGERVSRCKDCRSGEEREWKGS